MQFEPKSKLHPLNFDGTAIIIGKTPVLLGELPFLDLKLFMRKSGVKKH
jgi:hypothetical protein